MDIAFISNVVYPFVKGGAEKRIYEIGRRLATAGHDVTVYCRQYWNGARELRSDGMVLRAVAPEAEMYAGGRRSITEAIDFAVRLLRPFRRHLVAREHDVVVASVFPYFPVLSAKLATIDVGAPLVTTWHEVWRSYWDEYLGYLSPFGRATEYITSRIPQYPVAISDVTASRLADIGPDRESIEVVPNGIDVEQVREATPPDGGGGGRYDVLYAGRLVEHKNVDTLLQAFDRIADRHDATLGIIGDGPEADRLQARAAHLDASDRIEFLGFLDDYEDVLGHMHAARVFSSLSTREGFGITFVEAMAADCTIVAADHPDSAASEVLGDAGFLVEPEVDAAARVLERALDGDRPDGDPTQRAMRYDWTTVASQAETVYERAITGEWGATRAVGERPLPAPVAEQFR